MLVNKNVERGRATRAHVIEVATRLFTAHGYDGTSIEAVQAESGVSRGSLYHHFPGKEALFLAVLEEVGAGIARQGEDAARDVADPVALLRIGGLLWIRNAGSVTPRPRAPAGWRPARSARAVTPVLERPRGDARPAAPAGWRLAWSVAFEADILRLRCHRLLGRPGPGPFSVILYRFNVPS